MNDPSRDALAAVMAWLDGDDDRLVDVLLPYQFGRDELSLIVGLLALVDIERGGDDLRDLLAHLALVGATRPS